MQLLSTLSKVDRLAQQHTIVRDDTATSEHWETDTSAGGMTETSATDTSAGDMPQSSMCPSYGRGSYSDMPETDTDVPTAHSGRSTWRAEAVPAAGVSRVQCDSAFVPETDTDTPTARSGRSTWRPEVAAGELSTPRDSTCVTDTEGEQRGGMSTRLGHCIGPWSSAAPPAAASAVSAPCQVRDRAKPQLSLKAAATARMAARSASSAAASVAVSSEASGELSLPVYAEQQDATSLSAAEGPMAAATAFAAAAGAISPSESDYSSSSVGGAHKATQQQQTAAAVESPRARLPQPEVACANSSNGGLHKALYQQWKPAAVKDPRERLQQSEPQCDDSRRSCVHEAKHQQWTAAASAAATVSSPRACVPQSELECADTSDGGLHKAMHGHVTPAAVAAAAVQSPRGTAAAAAAAAAAAHSGRGCVTQPESECDETSAGGSHEAMYEQWTAAVEAEVARAEAAVTARQRLQQQQQQQQAEHWAETNAESAEGADSARLLPDSPVHRGTQWSDDANASTVGRAGIRSTSILGAVAPPDAPAAAAALSATAPTAAASAAATAATEEEELDSEADGNLFASPPGSPGRIPSLKLPADVPLLRLRHVLSQPYSTPASSTRSMQQLPRQLHPPTNSAGGPERGVQQQTPGSAASSTSSCHSQRSTASCSDVSSNTARESPRATPRFENHSKANPRMTHFSVGYQGSGGSVFDSCAYNPTESAIAATVAAAAEAFEQQSYTAAVAASRPRHMRVSVHMQELGTEVVQSTDVSEAGCGPLAAGTLSPAAAAATPGSGGLSPRMGLRTPRPAALVGRGSQDAVQSSAAVAGLSAGGARPVQGAAEISHVSPTAAAAAAAAAPSAPAVAAAAAPSPRGSPLTPAAALSPSRIPSANGAQPSSASHHRDQPANAPEVPKAARVSSLIAAFQLISAPAPSDGSKPVSRALRSVPWPPVQGFGQDTATAEAQSTWRSPRTAMQNRRAVSMNGQGDEGEDMQL